jgi:hypothetical protein
MSVQVMDALIVRHLQDIESASGRITDEIQKNVGKAIDDIVGEWAPEKDWFSNGEKFDTASDELILAPKNWKVPESSDKDEFFARFYFDAINAAQNEEGWENRAVQRYLLKVIENMDLRPPRAAA